MTNEEIIGRLERMAEHAVHTVGEKPYVMGLDDGIALYSAIEAINAHQPRVLTLEELTNVTDPVWYEERYGISSWALCIDVTCGCAYEDTSYEFFENYDNSYIREYADKCNVYWRCWTAQPTDEQRKAVKWK